MHQEVSSFMKRILINLSIAQNTYKMKRYLLLKLFLAVFAISSFTQSIPFEIRADLGRPLLKSELVNIKTVDQLHNGFPVNWIREIVSVDLHAKCAGAQFSSTGNDIRFNEDQLKSLLLLEEGCDFECVVVYIPELDKRQKKTIQYAFSILPSHNAEYPGGEIALNSYFRNQVIGVLDKKKLESPEFGQFRFSVDDQGRIQQVGVDISTGDQILDDLIIKSISDMPAWSPAKDEEGNALSQNFIVNLGRGLGC